MSSAFRVNWKERALQAAITMLLALALGWAPSAYAQGTCTGSGSLGPKLFEPGTNVTACPNLANPCEVGDVVEYRITAQNTSTDAGGLFATGVLGGDTCRVAPDPLAGSCFATSKACASDADCTLTVDVMLTNPPRPGTFVFDAGTDCTTLPNTSTVVQGCAAVDPNTVRVTIKGGVSAPAPMNTPVPLVEFRAVATTPITNPLTGQFGVNASAVVPAGGIFPAVGVTADTDCDPQEGWSATGNTSGFFPPVCEVEVDKQVSCDGGVTWVDSDALTGNNVFVTMNEDGTNADNGNLPCFGWNGEDVDGDGTPDGPGEAILVRYRARNSGNLALTSCTLMDSNGQIPAVTFPNAGAIALAGMTDFFGPTNLLCAPSLNAGEPDRASASCTCPGDLGTINSNTAFDDANFQCLTPSLQVQKSCEDENPVNNQSDTVRITVTNAGTADLVGCTVTDTLDLEEGQLDPACNGATATVGDGFTPGPTQNVPVTPAQFDLAMMTAQPVSGTFAELAQNACNGVSVTCTVDGTDKTITAEDEDSCTGEVPCSARFDKQISCDGVNWIDVSITRPDATTADDPNNALPQDCISWSVFDNGQGGGAAEPANKRFVVDNTGQAALSCTITDEVNGVSTDYAVTIPAGEVGIVPVPDTCSAEVSGIDTATLVCECVVGGSPDGRVPDGGPFMDQAEIECQTPRLLVSKTCEEQDAQGVNKVTINVSNPAGADGATLQNCSVVDALCGLNTTIAGPLAPGAAATPIMCDVTGLTDTTDNNVEVTCEIVDSGGKTIRRTATDPCEVGNCLTRTPGFWGTHPNVTALFLPVDSCGLSVDNVRVGANVSAIEDVCFSNQDARPNDTSPQQLQLIRQCTAAALNIKTSLDVGGSCAGFGIANECVNGLCAVTRGACGTTADCPTTRATIDDVIDACCDDTSICTQGASGPTISSSRCIEELDFFNNTQTDFDGVPAPFNGLGQAFCPAADAFEPALTDGRCTGLPGRCKAANGNGYVNSPRNLGPKK